MWRDFEDWGEGQTAYAVRFSRDCYQGPDCEPPDYGPLLDPANYRGETHYIACRDELMFETTDIDHAATFESIEAASKAIQRHRKEYGDTGRIYEVFDMSEI